MIPSLHRAYLSGQLSPIEITNAYLSRIAEQNPALGAFLALDAEGARAAAEASHARYQRGTPLSILDGIPFALKDNIVTPAPLPTTAGSRLLAGYIAPYTATVCQALLDAGAILLGKTAMDEFGFGSDGRHCAFGVTQNPLHPGLVPGGSSSGSAAAVAADLCVFALGSDTGGSVRLPAAFCGICGLRPTYGRISRFGLIAFASSFDTVGILAKDSEDLGILLSILSEDAPSTCAWQGTDATKRPSPEAPPLPDAPIIGLLPALMEQAEPEIASAVQKAAKQLEAHGATIVSIELPHLPQALWAYYTISAAQAASNLARYDGIRYGMRGDGDTPDAIIRATRAKFGSEAMTRILSGTASLSREGYRAEYLAARAIADALGEEMRRALTSCTCLLTPVCPRRPWRIGEESRYEDDIMTVPPSLAALPALSIPFEGEAIQLIGPDMGEDWLLALASRLTRKEV